MKLFILFTLNGMLFFFWELGSISARDDQLTKVDLSPRFIQDTTPKNFSLVDDSNQGPIDQLIAEKVKIYLEKIYDIKPDFYSLKTHKIIDDGLTAHYGFTAYVKDKRIANLYLAAHVQDQQIVHINGTALADIEHFDFPTKQNIPPNEAKRMIANHFRIQRFRFFEMFPVYYIKASTVYLAYEITLAEKAIGSQAWRVFLSAHDGFIINKEFLTADFTTGKGQIFPQNKVKTPKIETVVLPLLAGKNVLEGKYVKVFSHLAGQDRAASKDERYIYKANDPRFDEVSTYYFANWIIGWLLQADVSFSAPLTYNIRVPDPENGAKWNNANFDPLDNSINVGEGDNKFLRNLSQDSDVIIHETAHYAIYHYGGITSLSGESGAIHEGTADFITYHLTDDPCLGESAMVNGEKCIRTGQNKYRYPDDINDDSHASGDIWSGTLWQTRQALKANTRDDFARLTVKALAFIQNPRADFLDYSNALLLADKYHFAGKFKCSIANILLSRGFFFSTKEVDIQSCEISAATLQQTNALKRKSFIDQKNEEETKKTTSNSGCSIQKQPQFPSDVSYFNMIFILASFFLIPITIRFKRSLP